MASNTAHQAFMDHSNFFSGKFVFIKILLVQIQLEDPFTQPIYSSVPALLILAQFLKTFVGKFVMLDYDVIFLKIYSRAEIMLLLTSYIVEVYWRGTLFSCSWTKTTCWNFRPICTVSVSFSKCLYFPSKKPILHFANKVSKRLKQWQNSDWFKLCLLVELVFLC